MSSHTPVRVTRSLVHDLGRQRMASSVKCRNAAGGGPGRLSRDRGACPSMDSPSRSRSIDHSHRSRAMVSIDHPRWLIARAAAVAIATFRVVAHGPTCEGVGSPGVQFGQSANHDQQPWWDTRGSVVVCTRSPYRAMGACVCVCVWVWDRVYAI